MDRLRLSFFLQNTYIYIRKYLFHNFTRNPQKGITFIIDDTKWHPGLLDRLKAVVCVYHNAKYQQIPFKLLFCTPFHLEDYLEPNRYDWVVRDKSIVYSPRIRLTNYYGNGDDVKYKKNKAYHLYNYMGYNIYQRNGLCDWKDIWHNDFNELFRPSQCIISALSNEGLVKHQYICVHIRFVNSIGILEPNYPQKPLPLKDQEILIDKCLNQILKIQSICDYPIYVFSDSNKFLDVCKQNNIKTLTGMVRHISYANSNEEILKTFVDLYAMAYSNAIYAIKGEALYDSVFSYYASIIGGINYKSINLY